MRGCRDSRRSESWLAYAGGYETAKAGCLTVEVRAGAERQRVQIGVGAPCPGQKPPPQPDDG